MSNEITEHSYGAREVVEEYLSPGTTDRLLDSLKAAGFLIAGTPVFGDILHECCDSRIDPDMALAEVFMAEENGEFD